MTSGRLHDLPPANNFLDATQLDLLRRLNTRVCDDIPWERYESVVTKYLAGNLLIVSSWRGAPTLPAQEFGWVSQIATG